VTTALNPGVLARISLESPVGEMASKMGSGVWDIAYTSTSIKAGTLVFIVGALERMHQDNICYVITPFFVGWSLIDISEVISV
jgi:hypothetical protein